MFNAQGDVVALVDGTGKVVVEYSYDAWGQPLTITGSMKDTLGKVNPLRYRCYVYDEETGLYYLGSRYYNLVMGRFINADDRLLTGQIFLGQPYLHIAQIIRLIIWIQQDILYLSF